MMKKEAKYCGKKKMPIGANNSFKKIPHLLWRRNST
jgi:hypothetical protein